MRQCYQRVEQQRSVGRYTIEQGAASALLTRTEHGGGISCWGGCAVLRGGVEALASRTRAESSWLYHVF